MLLKIKILDKINCLLGKVILLNAIIMIGCLNCLSFDEQIHKKIEGKPSKYQAVY